MTPGKLKVPGMILFLLGLLTGLSIMLFKNPRMGLAAHLEAILNGIFLVVAGIIWDEIKISASLKMFCLVSLLYGTYANWLFTLLSAIWGDFQNDTIIRVRIFRKQYAREHYFCRPHHCSANNDFFLGCHYLWA